jgi:hypothetical protein
VAEALAPHPAFCPVSFKVLTSGLGANVGAAIPAVTEPDAGALAIRPGTVSGPYRAPPPPPLPPCAPSGLTIIDPATTRTSVSLTWAAPGTGSPADSYSVQVGPVDRRLDRRIEDKDSLVAEIASWCEHRNRHHAKAN